ncbi:MAG: bifunctional enoyl-CoA hydratase/phosphate acetyltransferase [Chloroflexi bacterium]|nr:bifunctional enoyl-CoA hydratase/phosphate acetyltransferase [Chloroflexota bacterium]MBU1747109.1 bifunctional enoyl-CoA hydratase/phosphate acetyltransferase [Chloroflexota bacterium]
MKTFADIIERAKSRGPRRVAIAAAHEYEALWAARHAQDIGIARCTLIGDVFKIQELARQHDIDISDMEIIHEPSIESSGRKAVALANAGKADMVMKGKMETADILVPALDSQHGLRTGKALTYIAIFEVPGMDRLIFVSDPGVIIAPTMYQKVEIVQNAIDVALALGIQEPKVAILTALENVVPKMPATVDAASLSKMAERGQIKGGLVDGPLALDNAISARSAEKKGIESRVAGRADILITPDIEAGNVLVKSLTYFAKSEMAAIVVGGKVPLVTPSRSGSDEVKMVSIALGNILAD